MTEPPPPPPPSDAPPARFVAYVGGYGADLTWYSFDAATGSLGKLSSVAAFGPGPSWLAAANGHVYVASESGNRVGAYAIDGTSGALTFVDDVAAGGTGPAHLSIAGKYVLVANYDAGTIAVVPIRADGGVGDATQTLAAGANAHQIIADAAGTHVFVPCKGADYVAQYNFDPATGTLTPNATPRVATAAGAGPRHLAFAPDGAHAYLVNENNSTITALSYDASTGRLAPLQTQSLRKPGATGPNTGAEVAVHRSGKLVFASNRGDDDIAVFSVAPDGKLAAVGHTPTGGATPRAFSLDPSGAWLYVANQNSGTITTFAVDANGTLTPRNAPISVDKPSVIAFVAL